MQVVDGVGQRRDAAAQEEGHPFAAHGDRLQLEVVRGEAELPAQVEVERRVVLHAKMDERAGGRAAVDVLAADVELRG